MLWDVNVHGLVLAQSVPAPGEGVPADPSGAPGSGAPGSTGGGRGAPDLLLPLLALMIVFMLVFSIFGQRRERKKREQLISSVRKHDKVQTIGGVIGSVVEVTDAEVLLKVDESSNTRIRFARSAVQQVLESSRAGGDKAAPA